ncbi:selenite/tellurite reduction operon b-type cytochrome membrane protein ExtQ [Geotalea toluenoxydans]|uniref:selenite/tellurite reduction operon b-type cytochrome membrane protein ExtQ n=1 Tax=Geotalea toluenoxydans TaxID=421624 RepID=UPI0006CF98FF|nr:selenite/tellurite reduction operon b-type cytochrome membrane protein ExtQ [Geotalea toluenoxydans]
MKEYVKSSPQFFRLIKISTAVVVAVISLLAILITAPLQEPADLAKVPNPVKSAWFLLWIQELVSYSKYLIYAVALTAVFFFILPWFPSGSTAEKARWFATGQTAVNVITIIVFTAITALTIIAMFFRGANWSLVVFS